MASIRQSITASSTISPVVFTPAAPFVAGNVLVLATVERGSPPPLRDPGAGWTLVEGSIQGDANGGLGAMWYATSAGESSISLLWPKIDGIIWELTEAATTPLDTTRANLQGASTTHSAGTFTSMPSSAVGLIAICAELNNAGAAYTPAAGWTVDSDGPNTEAGGAAAPHHYFAHTSSSTSASATVASSAYGAVAAVFELALPVCDAPVMFD